MDPAYLLRRNSGGEIALEREMVSVGRSDDNPIVVADTMASRCHALIKKERGSRSIVDLDSRNGTWVNGERVEERRHLSGGDVIRIGDTEFDFRQS